MSSLNSTISRGVAIAAICVVAAGATVAQDVAARIGDETITLQAVDQLAMGSAMQTYQQLYDARSAALDQIIAERLLEAEAKKAGQPVPAYVEQQIAARVTAPTDAEIAEFYEANKNRVGGKTLEEIKPQIVAFLNSQRQQEARKAYFDELRAANKVKIVLDPPRVVVDVAADEPAKGPADAPIEIVMFSEFQCPYCSRVKPTIDQLEANYGDKVRVVFRDFPLPMHQDAQKAAEAAQCANAQGKFWEYHDVLFANQRALGVDKLKEYAGNVGLDTAEFGACLDEGRYTEAVKRDEESGRSLGVSGTPAFFVNGRFLNGAQPYENFAKVIDDELARIAR